MDRFALDVAHMFAGGLVLVSFMLLYQDRMFSLINTFALHAFVVSISVAWQAHIQNAPHLYITAAIALVVKAIIISRLEPIPPKLVPTSSPANASMKRAVPRSATIAIRSTAGLNARAVANVGTRAAAHHFVATIT
jgi:hypothetical protein